MDIMAPAPVQSDVWVPLRRFSVDDYYRMAEVGILGADDRVELLDGQVVEMSPIGSSHAGMVNRLNATFSQLLGGDAVVATQNPVRLSDVSQPQPDIALLHPRNDFYRSAHPEPRDIYLLVEVCDTSGRLDRLAKLPLYASAGIPEVWIVDLNERTLEVYRRPEGRSYARMQRMKPPEKVAPEAFPEVEVDLEELFT